MGIFDLQQPIVSGGFASSQDLDECRKIHRRFGSTYYFASRGFAPRIRRRVDALYGFVRVADEIVDDAGLPDADSRARSLDAYRSEFLLGLSGTRPLRPVLRAFCDLAQAVCIPPEEPLQFLDAMAMDLTIKRYATYEALRKYMAGSAAVIGVMMCRVLETRFTERTLSGAMILGEAMQLTNFLRDVAEDAARGRIYLPQEDLDRFGVREEDILGSQLSDGFVELMRFEIERARALYRDSDPGIGDLPLRARRSVGIARILYSRILDRIEELDYNVFENRARTSNFEKVVVAGSVWVRAGLRAGAR